MSNITLDDLYSQAGVIRRAEIEGENTAERVGGLFWDIIDYLQQNPSGGSTPAALSHPLSDINLLGTNPDSNDKILLYSSGSWGYADKPTGGGGGGITLTDVWNSLAGNDATKQINAAHLSDTLDNYVTNSALNSMTWWGRSLVNGAVTGNLEGSINSITFSNGVSLAIDSNNTNTLKVYKSNGDAANIWASGGVSALGVGISGEGSGEEGATLNALLDSINENTDTLPTLTAGMTVMRNSNNTKWIASKLALNNLSDTSISGLSSGQVLVYRNGNWVNENYTPGTQGSTTLSGLTDTTISSTISGGQILYRTGTGNWINAAFGITTSNNLLSGITFNGASYNIADTKNTTGAISRNSTKLYLTGSETQASAPVTYTNSGCFVGTDNCLYSNSKKTVTADELATVQDYFTDGSAKKATRLTDNATKTAWGQTYWSGGQPQNVSGDLSNVGNINMDGAINIDRTDGDPYINMKSTSGILNVLLIHNDSDPEDDYSNAHVALGYGTAVRDQLPIKFFGREFVFEYATKNYTESGNLRTYSTDEAMKVGYMSIPVGQNPDDAVEEPAVYIKKNLFVGDGNDHYFPITYDSTNNALCFNGSIYATGGVSALGFQNIEEGESGTDANAVHKTGNETIDGTKTLIGTLAINDGLGGQIRATDINDFSWIVRRDNTSLQSVITALTNRITALETALNNLYSYNSSTSTLTINNPNSNNS